jgi:hypothetical protein
MVQVTGTALAAGAGALVSGIATAQTYTGVSDSDGGAYADQAGYGRSGGANTGGSGLTDNDSGATADPVGNGRGSGGVRAQGISDQDSGAMADPAGQGRGATAQRPAQPDGPVKSEVPSNNGMVRACNPRCKPPAPSSAS